jgi:hypothetical protein
MTATYAPNATVEGLMHVLRTRGPAALAETWTKQRLAMLAEAQLHDICDRLQRLKFDRIWIADDLKRLVEAWGALRHG